MDRDATERRRFVSGLGSLAAAALLAGCSGGDESGGKYSGYLSNVPNYSETVDRTGQEEVTVTAGAEPNNYLSFAPAAVKISTGTTVVWEWSGRGGSHNVVAADGDFESDLTDEEGHTFTQTFEDSGVVKYYCQPHKTSGMKGVVEVV